MRILLACLISTAFAAQPWPLERLFTRPFAWGTTPEKVKWSKQGHTLAFLWNAEGPRLPRSVLVRSGNPRTPPSHARRVRGRSTHRNPAEKDDRRKQFLPPADGLADFELSADGGRAVFALPRRSLRRPHRRQRAALPPDAHQGARNRAAAFARRHEARVHPRRPALHAGPQDRPTLAGHRCRTRGRRGPRPLPLVAGRQALPLYRPRRARPQGAAAELLRTPGDHAAAAAHGRGRSRTRHQALRHHRRGPRSARDGSRSVGVEGLLLRRARMVARFQVHRAARGASRFEAGADPGDRRGHGQGYGRVRGPRCRVGGASVRRVVARFAPVAVHQRARRLGASI